MDTYPILNRFVFATARLGIMAGLAFLTGLCQPVCPDSLQGGGTGLLEIGDITQVHYGDLLAVETRVYESGCWAGLELKAELAPQPGEKPSLVREVTQITPDKLNLVFDTSGFSPGNYIVRISLVRDDKVLDTTERSLSLRKFPPPGDNPKVTIAGNNAMLVEGIPFLPIISWGTSASAFKEVREIGFNTVVGPFVSAGDPYLAEHIKSYLDAAAKAGLKIMSTAVSYIWGDPPRLTDPESEQLVLRFRNHPALLGWTTGDEVFANRVSVKQMDEVYRTIRENDPGHPVFVDLMRAEVNNFQGVTTVSDIVGFNWYPIPQNALSSYIELLRRLSYRVAGRKPVWVVLQLSLGKERPRDPTPLELRCMTYMVLVHGAKGIGYFIYGAGVSPENKNALRDIFAEIKFLTPAILAASPELPVTVRRISGRGQVDVLTKEYGGKKYLMAVNIEDVPAEVSFRLSGAGSEASVLFENRKVKIERESFRDGFAGYAVHVYEVN